MTFEWVKNTAKNSIFFEDKEEVAGKGKYFKCRFLQPGLVKYDFGVCVLEKETIDKFIDTFVGVPVIIGHQDLTVENADKERVGTISKVWYDSTDGWYWCEGVIFQEEAINLIKNKNFNVSCQYIITEYSENKDKKLYNANPYDKVILNGVAEHLAIVENARYQGALISVNALDLTAENGGEGSGIKGHHTDKPKGKLLEEKREIEARLKEAIEKDIKEDDPRYNSHMAGIELLKKSLADKEEQIKQAKNSIIEAINDIKGLDMFKSLFKKKEKKMDKEEMKALFMECLTELKASNEAEKDAKEEDVKEKEEEKEAENKCKNAEEPDYKKMYEELKAKMEAANEEKEDKEEKDKAKNSIDEQIGAFCKEIETGKTTYVSQKRAIELGDELF